MARTIATLVGSLRKESFNLKFAHALQAMAPADFELKIIELGRLPIYNMDLEGADLPEAWRDFRQGVKACDAVLFITAEYNRSVPGVLKNAIDVGSRPYGESVWTGKPGAIISTTPGSLGGFGANHHLRQSMVFLDVPLLQQPEMYLSNVAKMFDDTGALKDADVKKLLEKFLGAYAAWIEKILPA